MLNTFVGHASTHNPQPLHSSSFNSNRPRSVPPMVVVCIPLACVKVDIFLPVYFAHSDLLGSAKPSAVKIAPLRPEILCEPAHLHVICVTRYGTVSYDQYRGCPA